MTPQSAGRLALVLVLAGSTGMVGCATVQPWQRGTRPPAP